MATGYGIHLPNLAFALFYPFRVGRTSLRTCLRGNLNYCINMMSRLLIQKASSGFPTYRESIHRSNGNLIYTEMCYGAINAMIYKKNMTF
ncbi:hypothetical protein EB837_14380 [Kluyvera ascorbata]|uniref:Uncharacterized protein n=1 Tax=Kluyvera ascorbata TaxID=51288 RepID=A0A3N2RZZ7_9ENTR|nr:hypothetical protein EB837_14380 [Kluyvera ascorbata]